MAEKYCFMVRTKENLAFQHISAGKRYEWFEGAIIFGLMKGEVFYYSEGRISISTDSLRSATQEEKILYIRGIRNIHEKGGSYPNRIYEVW